MHELPYVRAIIKTALKYSNRNQGRHLKEITLSISEISPIEPDSIKFYWRDLCQQYASLKKCHLKIDSCLAKDDIQITSIILD